MSFFLVRSREVVLDKQLGAYACAEVGFLYMEQGKYVQVRDLKKLAQNREEILKAKLFMFLHDVGKLQPGHQAKFIRGYQPPYFATQFSHYRHILNHSVLQPILSWNANFSPKISLSAIIEKHHGAKEQNDGIWAVFAQRVDRMDSGWDRDSIVATGVQPYKEFISITSTFGWTRVAYKRVSSPNHIQCSQPPPSLYSTYPLYYAGPTKFNQQQRVNSQTAPDSKFKPTHETDTGELVVKHPEDEGVWIDRAGDEWEFDNHNQPLPLPLIVPLIRPSSTLLTKCYADFDRQFPCRFLHTRSILIHCMKTIMNI